MIAITLVVPRHALDGRPFEHHLVARSIGELEAHLGGRAYLWQWCTAMTEHTRAGLALTELDAYSTAEKYGFTVAEASAERQLWRDRSLDRGQVGQ
jgi:hypothetical protein